MFRKDKPLPNLKKRESVFALFHDDKREIYTSLSPRYQFPKTRRDRSRTVTSHSNSWSRSKSEESDARARIWRLTYEWKGRLLAHHLTCGSGTSWSGLFNQSRHIDGTFRYWRTVEPKGLGQRDKSWGHRD